MTALPMYLDPEMLIHEAEASYAAQLFPDKKLERLGTFRDSRGLSVPSWPQVLLPSATIIIVWPDVYESDAPWEVVCHKRSDNGYWAFPGGRQEIGESILACAAREALEETGIVVCGLRLESVDSDPEQGAIVTYPDGNTVQYCNLTFTGYPGSSKSWELCMSEESTQLRWCRTDHLPEPFLPSHQWRLAQAISRHRSPSSRLRALPVR